MKFDNSNPEEKASSNAFEQKNCTNDRKDYILNITFTIIHSQLFSVCLLYIFVCLSDISINEKEKEEQVNINSSKTHMQLLIQGYILTSTTSSPGQNMLCNQN